MPKIVAVRTHNSVRGLTETAVTDETATVKIDLYDGQWHAGAIAVEPDGNGGFLVSLYRDTDFPLRVRRIDYFS